MLAGRSAGSPRLNQRHRRSGRDKRDTERYKDRDENYYTTRDGAGARVLEMDIGDTKNEEMKHNDTQDTKQRGKMNRSACRQDHAKGEG